MLLFVCLCFFFSSRRRHTRCALVTGVQTCALPISGLVIDPYFSATKMRWILDNVPEARAIGDALAFGTIESWLIWKLTGGAHLTDASNASRTQLMALEGRDWDDELCALLEVPRAHLPEIVR